MATPTYELIETTTLTSSASSVTFSSITQDYRDLVLVMNYKGTTSSILNVFWKANTDTTDANYSFVHMSGDGSSAFSGSSTGRSLSTIASPNDTGSALVAVTWLDYSATDKYKSWLLRANTPVSTGGAPGVSAIAGRWASTSALTSIELTNQFSRVFATGSVFSLYGIAS